MRTTIVRIFSSVVLASLLGSACVPTFGDDDETTASTASSEQVGADGVEADDTQALDDDGVEADEATTVDGADTTTSSTAPSTTVSITVSTTASTSSSTTSTVTSSSVTSSSETTSSSTTGVVTAQEALVEALARSVPGGASELGRMVADQSEARCVADHLVADIGVDRYDAAYGINVGSVEAGLGIFDVPYDRIDAEAAGAAIGACTDVAAFFRSIMAENEVPEPAQDCLVEQGLATFEAALIAELNQDEQLVGELGDRLNDQSLACREES